MDFIFLSAAAFEDMSAQDKTVLYARMSDPVFQSFCDAQEKHARDQLTSLDPDERGVTADEFRQRVREARLIHTFWSEFKAFTTEWAKRAQK